MTSWQVKASSAAFIILCSFSTAWAGDSDTYQHVSLDVSAVNAMTTGETLPFYLTTNQHGVLAPTGSQTFMRTSAIYTMDRYQLHLRAGLDAIGYATTHLDYYGHMFQLQQCFLKATYSNYSITLGQREQDGYLVDPHLSSGNMLFSGNARPAFGVRLGTDHFGKMRILANLVEGYIDVSYGKLTDGNYNGDNWRQYETVYGTGGINDVRQHHLIQGAWIHQSRVMLRSSSDYPFYATVGVEHAAMYGGKVDYVKQHGFTNFILASIGAKGKGHNGLPATFNHLMSYDMRMLYKKRKWSVAAYRQIYADDLDAGAFKGGLEGLNGLEVRFNRFRWVNHIVAEYIQTSKQGGVVYANDTYWYDGQKKVHTTAGNSNIYHDEWYGAWAHYGMALGNPLITSPIYNPDHYGDFAMNMVKAMHIGCEGKITDNLTYRLRYHHAKTWGTPFAPLAATRQNNSGSLELHYNWGYWKVLGQLAYDRGTIMGDQWGGGLTVTRHFELRNW